MKKNLIKALTSITIISTIISSIAFADTAPILRLTLEEAQAMALQNNIKFQLQDSYISDALDDYYDMQDKNDKLSHVPTTSMIDYFNRTITPEIAVDTAANAVQLSRFEKKDITRASNFNVKTAFLNIKVAQYTLENKKIEIATKLRNYNVAKIRLEQGMITSDELKTFEKAYNDSVSDLQSLDSDLKNKFQTLNRYIGRPLTDYNIEIVFNLAKINIDNLDIDKIREAYLENNKNYFSLEQNVTVAKRKYDLTKERYEHFEKLGVQNSKQSMLDAYSDAERDYNNAMKSFEDATKDLDISIDNAYKALKDTADAVSRLDRNIKDANDQLDKAKIKYDNGMMSKNDYEDQTTALKTMQNSLDSLLANMDMQYSNLMLYVPVETAAK